ncbi:MAG: VanZ family protein [Flavobacterium sp.]
MPKVKVSGADKYGHFSFHLVFTLLWSYYFWLKQNHIALKKLVYLVLTSLCFGILIEFLQGAFTKTRQADSLDVLANFGGAMTGFLIFVLIKFVKKA